MQAINEISPIQESPTLARGRIIEALEDKTVMVASDASAFKAAVSASCFLRPDIGDDVLCALDGNEAFILAVLTRANTSSRAACDLPPATNITADDLLISSRIFGAKADKSEIDSAKMSLKSDHLTISSRLARMASKLTSLALGSLLAKSSDSRVVVEATASIQAGRLSLHAQKDVTARAEALDLKAEGPVSIDGQHLRLG